MSPLTPGGGATVPGTTGGALPKTPMRDIREKKASTCAGSIARPEASAFAASSTAEVRPSQSSMRRSSPSLSGSTAPVAESARRRASGVASIDTESMSPGLDTAPESSSHPAQRSFYVSSPRPGRPVSAATSRAYSAKLRAPRPSTVWTPHATPADSDRFTRACVSR